MPVELRSLNIVVVAARFNPSVITERWLLKKGIVLDNEFLPGSFYTPPAVNVQASTFELLALPDRVQIKPRGDRAIALERFSTLLLSLPETPYKALGINFEYIVWVDGENIVDTLKRTFYCADSPFAAEMGGGDMLFGGFVRVKHELGYLHFDVKPGEIVEGEDIPNDRGLLRINFHIPVGHLQEPAEAIAIALKTIDQVETIGKEAAGALTKKPE